MEGSGLSGPLHPAADGQTADATTVRVAVAPDEIDDLFATLTAPSSTVVAAGWDAELRDFALVLADARRLRFSDCLQVSFHRAPSAVPPWTLGSWWSDEPSPFLLTMDPAVRFQYRHLVIEVGEGLLRVACRSVELSAPDPMG